MKKEFDGIEHEILFNKLIRPPGADASENEKEAPDSMVSQDILSDLINKQCISCTGGNLTSYRKCAAIPVVFIKRVIRKLTYWYMRDVVEQINLFHRPLCSAIEKIMTGQDRLEAAHRELQSQIQFQLGEKDRQIDEMKACCEKMSSALASIEKTNSEWKRSFEQQLGEKCRIMEHYAVERLPDLERASFSQAGEDAIAFYIFLMLGKDVRLIRYLDIGCNHYKKMSNSYYFYLRGAHGVLIDANPDFIEEIKNKRPRDTVLNLGIGTAEGEQEFYILNGDGLSSFDRTFVDDAVLSNPDLRVDRVRRVTVSTVGAVVERYFSTAPDLVSLDIEGSDLDVLRTWDFEKWRPAVFIVETIGYSLRLNTGNRRNDLLSFMKANGYAEYAFTGINSIFIDECALDKGEFHENSD